MKTKKDITVGVIRKVREYYETDSRLGGLIKVDRIVNSERFGDDIQVYYQDINKYDRVFVNGVLFVPDNGGKSDE